MRKCPKCEQKKLRLPVFGWKLVCGHCGTSFRSSRWLILLISILSTVFSVPAAIAFFLSPFLGIVLMIGAFGVIFWFQAKGPIKAIEHN